MLDGEGSENQALTDNAGALQQMDAADRALEQTVEHALSGSEAPAEPSGAAADKPAAPAESAPAAQPRDPRGRFSEKPPSAAPPSSETPAPAPEAQDEPTADAEAPAGEQPPEPETAAQDYTEATYQYNGQEVAIPGSAVGENGAFIPTEQFTAVQELLALGRSAREGSIRQQLRTAGHDAARVKTQIDAAFASRDQVFSAIDAMVEAELKGDTERGFTNWLQDLAQNWRILKAESKAKGVEAELAEERRQRETFQQEREREEREPQIRGVIEGQVAHFAQLEGLDPEARKTLIERLSSPRFRDQIVHQAREDDPRNGIQRGQWVVEYGVIEDEVKFFAKAGGGRTSAQRVQQLQQDNARRQGQPSNAPPVATARKGPAPSAGRLPDLTGKSAEEVDELIWDKGGYKQL